MQAKLRVIGGKANKKEVLLTLPSVVGRSREAGLTIAHPMISRQHCEIFEAGGLVRIRDLGSTNGTYVAGKKVAESVLRPRDQFSVGPLTFEVDYEYVGDSTVAEDAPAASILDFAPASGREAAEADEKVFQFLADEEPPPAEPPAAAAPEPAESPAESAAGGLDFLGAPAESSPAPPERGPEATELLQSPPSGAMPSIAPAAESPAPPGMVLSIAPPDGQLPDFSAWDAAATANSSQTVDAPPHVAPAAGFDQEDEPAAEYPFADAELDPRDVPPPTSPRKPKKGGWWRFGKGKPTAKGSTGGSRSACPPSFEGFDDGAGAEPAAPRQEQSAPTSSSPTPPPSPPPARPEDSPGQAASGRDADLDEFLEGLK